MYSVSNTKGLGAETIPRPKHLDMWQCFNHFVICCCKQKSYLDYNNKLDTVG